jgi:CBS domain containing-hemolysin-like protein
MSVTPICVIFGIQASLASASAEGDAGMMLGRIALLLLLLLLNGFFVAAEFSVVKARGSRLELLIEKGDARALLLGRIGAQLESFLSVTQLGITVSSIALGVIAEPFFAALLDPWMIRAGQTDPATLNLVSFSVSFVAVTFLHVVLGELLPKNLALRRPLQTALFIARPLHWIHALARPTVWVFNGTARALLKWIFRVDSVSQQEIAHTAEELAVLVSATEKSEVTEVEKEILINALELSELEAREIMLPRNKVVVLDINDSFEQNLTKAIASRHTRFPVVNGHLDRTLGLIHVKDLMQVSREPRPDLKSIIRPLELVPERMAADLLLKKFLSARAHMALVVDEYGGSLGIVTLDNVVEELVGDINDEFDEAEQEDAGFERISEHVFEVDGTLPMYELADLTGLELEDPEVSTVGGYVTHLIGRFPKTGEQIQIEDYLVTVAEADERVIGKLHFERIQPNQPEEGAAVRISGPTTQDAFAS